MRIDTPGVATHLLSNPDHFVTTIGKFLQPALFNRYDRISLRTQTGIHVLTPGITGWAQGYVAWRMGCGAAGGGQRVRKLIADGS